MGLSKFNVREIQSHPGRATLTLLSIVLGVSAVVAVTIATASTRDAYKQMFLKMTGRAALEVIGAGGGDFDESVLEIVENTPGVKAAVPVIQRSVILRYGEKKATLQMMGIDPTRDDAVRDYELIEGRFFDDADGVLLAQTYARSLGLSLNDKVRLITGQGGLKPKPATIVGLLAPTGVAAVSQGGALFMPMKRAQALTTGPGKVDAIHIVLEDDSRAAEVQESLAKQLPEGLTVGRPAARTEYAEATLNASEQGLTLATILSLVVAGFIILNTFLMNVSERRRQLAIMRAIGATRRQIIRMIVTEGLMMGVAGTALGIIVGMAAAKYIAQGMGGLFHVSLPTMRITPQPFVLAAAFGLGISLLATYWPARKAGRVSPLEGMRPVISDENQRISPWVTSLGIALFLLGIGVLMGTIFAMLPIGAAAWGAVVALSGLLTLIPRVLAPMAGFVYRLLAPVLGVEGLLACRQILRQRVRTTLTIVVLFVAITFGIGTANSVIDNISDVKEWYRRTIVGDFFVRAGFPDLTKGTGADMPDGLDKQLREIPGVTHVGTVRYLNAQVSGDPPKEGDTAATDEGGSPVVVIVREVNDDMIRFDLRSGDPAQINRQLLDGQVVIGTVLAHKIDKGVGDQITVATREGSKQLRIAGTSNEYMVGGLVVHMDREAARRLFDIQGVSAYIVRADHERIDEVEATLRKLADESGLLLQSYSELTRSIDAMVNGIVASLWALLALGSVVAGFGVVNTLTMNVLEQTREIGLLRIIAMTRAQIRKTIMSQAAIIGVIGLAPGILTGVLMAWLMNLSTLPVLGKAITFVVHPVLLLGCLVIGLLIVIGAGYLPARRAARLDLLDALHYE